MVVGGGPAGIEASLVCAQQGHAVSLYDKQPSLGSGQLKLAATLPGKDKISWLRDYLITQARKQERISLHLQTEVTEELVKEVKPDVLITATGAYTSNRDDILFRLHKAGVEIITEHLVREVTDTKVIAIDKNRRERSIEADKVVVAAGAASARELDANLKGEVPQIYVVGDATEPRDIAAATYDGALIALLPKAWRKWKEGKDYFALR